LVGHQLRNARRRDNSEKGAFTHRVQSQKGRRRALELQSETRRSVSQSWLERSGWLERASVLSAWARDQKTPIGSSQSVSILPTADSTFSLGGSIRMILALTAVLILTILITALVLMGRQDHPAEYLASSYSSCGDLSIALRPKIVN